MFRGLIRLKYFVWALLIFILVVALAFSYVVASTFKNPITEKLQRERTNTSNKVVNDVTELNPVKVIDIIVPHSEEEIVKAVKESDHVSIGGGRNSMGGQTASERAIQIDMREYNKVLSLLVAHCL
jgi:Na+-transporting methylmalonyl-CoA/oxaloacetate decarboxylase gamma subunit